MAAGYAWSTSEPSLDSNTLQRANPPPTPQVAANRLSIAHLLLWTATTGLVLAAVRPAFVLPELSAETSEEIRQRIMRGQQIGLAILLSLTPFWGAALAGLALGIWRRIRPGASFPAQPGHWLLIIVGGQVLFWLPVSAAVQLENSWLKPGPLAEAMEVVVAICPLLIALISLIAAAASLQNPFRWKLVFWLTTGAAFSFTVGICAEPFLIMGLLLSISSIFGLVVATTWDIWSARSYDVLHWTGIAVVATTVAACFFWLVSFNI